MNALGRSKRFESFNYKRSNHIYLYLQLNSSWIALNWPNCQRGLLLEDFNLIIVEFKIVQYIPMTSSEAEFVDVSNDVCVINNCYKVHHNHTIIKRSLISCWSKTHYLFPEVLNLFSSDVWRTAAVQMYQSGRKETDKIRSEIFYFDQNKSEKDTLSEVYKLLITFFFKICLLYHVFLIYRAEIYTSKFNQQGLYAWLRSLYCKNANHVTLFWLETFCLSPPKYWLSKPPIARFQCCYIHLDRNENVWNLNWLVMNAQVSLFYYYKQLA